MNHTLSTQSATARGGPAARLSLVAAVLFLMVVALLHLIKPELDPSWRMVSEYAIGRYGWLMTIAFLAWALSYASIAAAISAYMETIRGKIGLMILLVSALGTTMAAIFPTDPITIHPDAVTLRGNLHGVSFFLGVPTFLIAATLISWSLIRHRAWASSRRSLAVATGVVWLSFLGFTLALATMFTGTFGPDVLIGWPGRLLVLASIGWVMVVAWHTVHVNPTAEG